MQTSTLLRIALMVSCIISPFLQGQIPTHALILQSFIQPEIRETLQSSGIYSSEQTLTQFEPAAYGIILFIGDGMGQYHRAAARMLSQPENSQLTMDSLAIEGWSRTSSANSAITDSAAGGTAISTGEKTNNGMVGVAPDGTWLRTILESARAKSLSTGLITTTQLAHADPATFGAHVLSRSMNERDRGAIS